MTAPTAFPETRMKKQNVLKLILPGLLLVGQAMAQDIPANRAAAKPSAAEPEASQADPKAANRKAYEALYSDIIQALPDEGRSKVDSARGRVGQENPGQPADIRIPEEAKRAAVEKRKRELDQLPPEVRARVDKALSDLDTRRMEKQTEFKELK